ncbi:MAG: hypothetical protein QM597_04745 [Aeromicrobium sp.]|uniref:hypothetical protein n=1 Tax=Aeromicrobium sp. TaxID=1871063 RepID=UPI0039E2161D
MTWTWTYEDADGNLVGASTPFPSRGDAETWIGEAYPDLVEEGVAQVRLLDGDTEVYGPMSLSA